MKKESKNIKESNLTKVVEAAIFASEKPISLKKLAIVLDLPNLEKIENAIASLNKKYQDTSRSFLIRKIAGGYTFATKKEFYPIIEKLYDNKKKIKLTTSTLEVLALIAYQQPITRAQIDNIRGVNSTYHLHNLLEVKLIKIAGRLKGVGRPILYATTDKFLKFFGLDEIKDLPNLHQIKELMEVDVSTPQRINKKDEQLSILEED